MSLKELKDQLDALQAQREMFEIEAEAIHFELTSPGLNGEPPAGLKDSLVDSEGFPRGDINIYNVKNKRKRLAEINTDHKQLMKKIEQLLASIYQLQSDSSTENIQSVLEKSSIEVDIKKNLLIIATLDEVLEGSPAESAGIKNGDELLKFGEITTETPSTLQAIAKLVANSVNKPISIQVKRNQEIVSISLIPQTWNGRGLLGCHLSPLAK